MPGWRNLQAGRWQALCSGSSVRKDVQTLFLFRMLYIYAIYSLSRNYIYVGLTDDMERRFAEHQSGKNKTTKPYRPYDILLVEEYSSRVEARKREVYLKSGTGKEFL